MKRAGLNDIIHECKFARCHQRFPVPVIFYKNAFICRSSTLSKKAEALLRNIGSSVSSLLTGGESTNKSPSFNLEIQRQWDIELLRRYRVKHIVDLMVEMKKVKLGVTITSSEKTSIKYKTKFMIHSMPYPGMKI